MSDCLCILFKICILTLQCLCQTLGAWWEVDLGQSIDAKRVNIIQAPIFLRGLSDFIVKLLDRDDKTIAMYRIGDASQLKTIDISYTDFTSSTQDSQDWMQHWMQYWAVSFTKPDNSAITTGHSNGGGTTVCYPPSVAFNRAFDDFAADLAIDNAAVQDQCKMARERMGFESDHPVSNSDT